jgi:3-hydroxyisobutyrate dehydrogenase-like beta-hydroxyacid dehydrogenase
VSGHTEAGIAGLGMMGSAIARRLLSCERSVRVHDIRPGAADELTQDGATAADSPALLAASGVVIRSLNTADIVEQVVFGPDGVLSAVPDGVLLIDRPSTPRPTSPPPDGSATWSLMYYCVPLEARS